LEIRTGISGIGGVWYDKKLGVFRNMVDVFDNELSLFGRYDDASLLLMYTTTEGCSEYLTTFPMWDEKILLAEYLHENYRPHFSKDQVLNAFSFILSTVPFTSLRKDILFNFVDMRCQIVFEGKHPKDVVNNRPWLNPNLY
jgi:hypothetical protein